MLNFTEDFFKREIKWDFPVGELRKRSWAAQLEVLKVISDICRKYQLTWYVYWGTLIGAVRHKGFIPWDDDIDLSISRLDYIKLCKIATSEFQHPYFFQTEDTDPGLSRGHAQLRNSDTTAIIKDEKEIGYTFNQGIFIDIFPIDNVPDDPEERKQLIYGLEKNRNKSISYSKLFYGKNPGTGYRRIAARILQIFIKLFHVKYNNRYFKQLEIDKTKYKDIKTSYIANLYKLINNNPEKLVWKKEWFNTSLEVPFEFTTIRVPIGFEDYLLSTYGNWKEFVIGDTTHGNIIFDTDHSYKEYL